MKKFIITIAVAFIIISSLGAVRAEEAVNYLCSKYEERRTR